MENEQMNNQNPNYRPGVTFTRPTINKAPVENTTSVNNSGNTGNVVQPTHTTVNVAPTANRVEEVPTANRVEQPMPTDQVAQPVNTTNAVAPAKENVNVANPQTTTTSRPVASNTNHTSTTPSPKKPKSGKGKAVGKSIFFGSVSAAAVAGVAFGAMYLKKPKEYVLTYVINGEVIEVEVNEDSLLSNVPAPSVTGYSFDGWYVDPTYTTKLNSGYSFTGDISLYPKFNPNKYTVTYYSNNGVGGVFSQDVYFNSEYTTVLNTFEKPNYTFVGWSTRIDARYDDANIIPQNQVALLDTEGVTLYAVWKGVDRNITFDTTDMMVNGEAHTIEAITIPHGEAYTLPVITGTVVNASNNLLKFAGYTINGNVYQPGASITITENTSISINWQSATAMLNFNIQAPYGEIISNISPMAIYSIEDSYAYANLPAPDAGVNYEFIGWNTSADGSGTTYLAGESFTTDSTTAVLYAMWQGKTRQLNIYNGGSIVDTITCRYGDTITLPTYTLDKYTFIGFNDAQNYMGTSFSGNIVVQFADEEVNLYAEYSRNKITVSFNANGGIGSIDNITINSEELYSLSATDIANQREAITRRYYTLAGWSTDQYAEPNTASFDISAGSTNLPLYAIWSRNQVQVTYAPNIESTVPVAHKIDQGTDYTFSEAGFAKDGYYIVEFKVNGTSYKSGDILPAVEVDNLRVEVVWKKIEKVLFKNAGNISTVDTVSGDTVSVEDVAIGTKIIAPYVAVENSYKTNANGDRVYFAGWATTENATKPTVFAKSTELTVADTQQIYYAVYMEASTCLDYTYNSANDNYIVSLNDSIYDITLADNYTLVVPNTYNGKPVVELSNTSPFVENLWNTWESLPIKHAVIAEGVTSIGGSAFFLNTHLTDVTMPNGLTRIDVCAFAECANLSLIQIPETVTIIGESAFTGCINLKSIELPAGLQELGVRALSNTGLISVEIPNSITSISGTFQGCTSLSSVRLPSNLTEIGAYTFYNCANLKSIDIPDTVTIIGEEAFSGTGIETLVLPNTIESIGYYAFSYSAISSINIPTSLTTIGLGWFYNCNNLKNIIIPDNITHIDEESFWYTGLESITIPSSVTGIYPHAFHGCKSLKSATINTNYAITYDDLYSPFTTSIGDEPENDCPIETVIYGEGVTSIPDNAWEGCGSLKKVVIPEGVATIGNNAFWCCYNLSEVTIPEGVTTIGVLAFGACGISNITLPSSLRTIGASAFNSSCLTEVVIPEGVTTIGASAFGYVTGLTSVIIPSTVTTIGDAVFENCLSLQTVTINTNTAITYSNHFIGCTDITTVTYGEGVTSIPDNAWDGCETLVTINLPTSLRTIGEYAFGLTGVVNVVIPEGVTTIKRQAFSMCLSLQSVQLPSTLKSLKIGVFKDSTIKTVNLPEGLEEIGEEAFSNSSIEAITIPSTVKNISRYTFDACSSLAEVILPSSLTSIGDYAFYGCGSLKTINLPSNLVSIGNNAFEVAGLESIELPNTLTTIGEYAFSGNKLTSLVIPSSVTSIGGGAFEQMQSSASVTINTNTPITYGIHFDTSNIATVTYGEGVTSIPADAWAGVGSLTTVTLPSTIKTIGNTAFGGTGLNSINLPTGLNTIGAHAFESTNLGDVVIPNTVTTIGEGAFVAAYITSITIPSSVISIGDGAFSMCYSLASVTINTNAPMTHETHFGGGCASLTTVAYGEGVTSIPADAWKNCATLTTLTFPNSLKSVGSYAFYNCSEIFQDGENLLKEGVETVGESAFDGCGKIWTIYLPSTLTSVGDNAFKGLGSIYDLGITINTNLPITYEKHFKGANIHSVTFGDNVIAIPENAWNSAGILYSVTIGKNVTSVGDNAFANNAYLQHVTINTNTSVTYSTHFGEACTNLTTVTYGEGVISIPDNAWDGCDTLTTVNLPEGLLEIGAEAFDGCNSLALTLPNTVTKIRDGACNGVLSVNIPNAVEEIGAYAFASCEVSGTIPNTIKFIGLNAFNNSFGLVDVTISGDVEVYKGAFSEIESLESISYNSEYMVVPENLCWGCPNLINVNLGANISTIKSNAFFACTSLTTIYFRGITVIEEDAFAECSAVKNIYFYGSFPAYFQFEITDLPLSSIEKIYASSDCYSDILIYFADYENKVYQIEGTN